MAVNIIGSICWYSKIMPDGTQDPNSSANFTACAVVAVAGEMGDWAAYIGSMIEPNSDTSIINRVARWGDKLPEEVARAFFPNVDLIWRP